MLTFADMGRGWGTPLKSPLYVLFNFGPCSKCGTLFEWQGIVQLSECMYASGKITQHNKEINRNFTL